MFTRLDETNLPWKDYELIDSGDHKKLERYGDITLVRPDTEALWKPLRPNAWREARAEFAWREGKGVWAARADLPESWELSRGDMRFEVRPTSFKHMGLFPEQAPQWEWIGGRTRALREPVVLNLFGYTGLASIAGAKAGALVTHVDASKQSIAWAKENAALSGIKPDGIRYILDDASKFAKREVRRGARYDGIILDPPAFGRGPKGEVWKIEEDLIPLMDTLGALLENKKASFLVLNGYAAGYTPVSFAQLVEGTFGSDVVGEYGELRIKESSSERVISSGIYARFVR